MVRLRVLFAVMLGAGLMGLGIGYEMVQRSLTSEKTRESIQPPACSVDPLVVLGDSSTTATTNHRSPTIHIPRFKVQGGQTNLTAGIEIALTEAVAKAINSRTIYKVVLDNRADMELTGTITDFCCRCPPDYLRGGSDIREPEILLVVDLNWRDLRTGESLLVRKDGSRPPTVELRSITYWLPELSESIERPRQNNISGIVEQILGLLETP